MILRNSLPDHIHVHYSVIGVGFGYSFKAIVSIKFFKIGLRLEFYPVIGIRGLKF